MPSIRSVETVLPELVFSVDDVTEIGKIWLHDKPEQQALFNRFVRSSNSSARHFAISRDELLALGGMNNRSELFERLAPALGASAVEAALRRAEMLPADIASIVFTSCTCPTIPAVDALIVERSQLRREVARLPVFQHGCAGGVVGLEIAADLSLVRGPIALASVELCSLVFQAGNPTPAQLVGSAIFADGAACAIVVPEERGLVFRAKQSYLVPNSRHLMGYDTLDNGFHLRLDRELPQALATVAPELVQSFLGAHGLNADQIDYWLFHPGGNKILDFLERTFELRSEQCHWARDVLQGVGNMSSATILFVLNAFLESKVARAGDRVLMVGVGPGLTIELILFEWVE